MPAVFDLERMTHETPEAAALTATPEVVTQWLT